MKKDIYFNGHTHQSVNIRKSGRPVRPCSAAGRSKVGFLILWMNNHLLFNVMILFYSKRYILFKEFTMRN